MTWEQIKGGLGALGAVIAIAIAILEHLNVLYEHPYIAFAVAGCGITAYVAYVSSLIFRHVREDIVWIFSPLVIVLIFSLSGMYQLWPTPPLTKIFVSDVDDLAPADTTFQRRVFAHLWFRDSRTKISKVEINWGDRQEWEPIDSMELYYVLPHEYKTPGKKIVRLRVTNSYGLSSYPADQPPTRERDYWQISINQSNGGGVYAER
jgi:hypothetical protein